MDAKRSFWDRWRWHRIRRARKEVRVAQDRLNAICELDTGENEGPLVATAQRAQDELGLREDDLSILLQEKLLRSARHWRILVPSVWDKSSWNKSPSRKRPMLKPEVAYGIREQILQRWVIVAVILFGLSSIVQAVFAVLSYCAQTR